MPWGQSWNFNQDDNGKVSARQAAEPAALAVDPNNGIKPWADSLYSWSLDPKLFLPACVRLRAALQSTSVDASAAGVGEEDLQQQGESIGRALVVGSRSSHRVLAAFRAQMCRPKHWSTPEKSSLLLRPALTSATVLRHGPKRDDALSEGSAAPRGIRASLNQAQLSWSRSKHGRRNWWC